MPTVSLTSKSKVFEVEENEILYDALDQQGETLPHGCLSGSCGACRIEVMQGMENLKPAGVIEQNTLDSIYEVLEKKYGKEIVSTLNIRLACRARVQGDISFEPLKRKL